MASCSFPKDGIVKWEKELWDQPWIYLGEGGGAFPLVVLEGVGSEEKAGHSSKIM